MAYLHSKTGIRAPKSSGGGGDRGPIDSWPRGGGGGGGRGGDDNPPSYRERLLRYRMLIAFFLTCVVMIFVTFTTAYLVRKAGAVWDPARNEFIGKWVPTNLPFDILLMNTGILLISSLTLEVARRRAAEDVALAPIANIPGIHVSENRSLPWVWGTVVLGLAFLMGQYLAWRQLRLSHINIETNVSSGFFFILTGLHAVHLMGGILALLYGGLTYWLLRPPETRRIVIDVTAWYWHFKGLLWIYVFALLYFAR